MNQKAYGFTIVELLIVIVVIGILAAISIVAYNNVQHKARISIVQSDLANAKKKLMVYHAEQGRYPYDAASLTEAGLGISSTANYEVRASYNNFYYCSDVVDNEFAIGVRVAGSPAYSLYVTSSEDVSAHTGLINSASTCSKIGLAGTSSADGAYLSSGLNTAGVPASWLLQSSN